MICHHYGMSWDFTVDLGYLRNHVASGESRASPHVMYWSHVIYVTKEGDPRIGGNTSMVNELEEYNSENDGF